MPILTGGCVVWASTPPLPSVAATNRVRATVSQCRFIDPPGFSGAERAGCGGRVFGAPNRLVNVDSSARVGNTSMPADPLRVIRHCEKLDFLNRIAVDQNI